jgi:fructokinase
VTRCHAAVELGGTRVAVVAGDAPGRCSEVMRLPTTGPDETLSAIVGALRTLRRSGWDFTSVGLACFGPLELDKGRAQYGHLLKTPKPGWTGVDVAGALADGLDAPVMIETDVNAAAIGEGRWGACQGLGDFAYITAGTGVGAGLCIGGAPVHGLLHPEAGHLRPVQDTRHDPFPGVCGWHGGCVEGLASGPAITSRTGKDPSDIGEDDPVWDLAGDYLGQLCAALTLIVSPRRIVLGGGVGRRPGVLEAARRKLEEQLSGYLVRPRPDEIDSYLVEPGLGSDSGLFGALALAQDHGEQAKLSASALSPSL